MEKDYYDILGVSKDATADQIKQAYRKLALQYHPDRNKEKEASEKFKEVTKAYEVLSDSQKRQMYDQLGHQAFESSGAGGPFGQGSRTGQYGPFSYTYTTSGGNSDSDFGGFSDPFEIFEQFFGGGSPFGARQRRPVYSITIDFMEAVKGVEKKVTIEGKTHTIKIPAGVDDGTRIRFGEYDVLLGVRPDRRFQRDGVDIITEVEIPFTKAILGDGVSVDTIDGQLKVRIPSGTQPGTVIRLKGQGVSHLRGSDRGDHYVKIKVMMPKSISRRQKELLEQFEDEGQKTRGWF